MRILFDSKELCYKEPFGTLIPGQVCKLIIYIPASVGTVRAECVLELDGSDRQVTVPMEFSKDQGVYQIFSGSFALEDCGLYFYHFRIYKPDSCFGNVKRFLDFLKEIP